MGIPAVVLPIGDIARPGEQHIADCCQPVAAVDHIAVVVFQPEITQGIAGGQRGLIVRVCFHLGNRGVQAVEVLLQRKLDAVGQALHHQLHLAGLAFHQGRAVIFPDQICHNGQHDQKNGSHSHWHPEGAERFQGGALFLRVRLVRFHGGFSFHPGRCLLFPAKNVILLIKYQFQVSIFDGFGQRKYGEATMSYHVLIVDDDPAICKLLSKVMVSNEMEPLVVNSGAAALDLIARQSNTLDMILMDITLGDMEGFDVIQTIRRNGVTTPVIIISGRNEDYDFMYGLSLGADDYVTKPFRPQILGAKVKALIRRSKSFSQENSQQISCGPFLCDTTTMRFYKNNVELNLSEKERSLLLLFVRHPQQVFTKDMIYEQIWGNLIAVDDNAIMVYINRLRSKIEDNARTPQHIITIRGVGYRFVP